MEREEFRSEDEREAAAEFEAKQNIESVFKEIEEGELPSLEELETTEVSRNHRELIKEVNEDHIRILKELGINIDELKADLSYKQKRELRTRALENLKLVGDTTSDTERLLFASGFANKVLEMRLGKLDHDLFLKSIRHVNVKNLSQSKTPEWDIDQGENWRKELELQNSLIDQILVRAEKKSGTAHQEPSRIVHYGSLEEYNKSPEALETLKMMSEITTNDIEAEIEELEKKFTNNPDPDIKKKIELLHKILNLGKDLY